jgi:hypothetical protein
MMQTPHHQHRPSGHRQPSFELSPHLRPQRDDYPESEPDESEFDEDEEFQAVEEMQMEEDPLEVFVAQEELPVGTPGGKKADLRRGALVDGAKHERGGEWGSVSRLTICLSPADDEIGQHTILDKR